MAEAHHIPVIRTARYYTLGTLHNETSEIWIVLHGYAQLAKHFIENFTALETANRFIVAPEGLSRFYAKGFGGAPAASWMTSEDRTHEISDYINYLDKLYAQLRIADTKAKIVLLGFSQGVATATRWLNATSARVDHLVICSGEIAAELTEPLAPRLTDTPVTYLTAVVDPLITPGKHAQVMELMETLGATTIEFQGAHEINREALEKAAALISLLH